MIVPSGWKIRVKPIVRPDVVTITSAVVCCNHVRVLDSASGNRVMFMQHHPPAGYLAQTNCQTKL